MLPASRIQTAIEILDQLFSSWRSEKRIAADALIDRYFRARRYIGSKDRGAIAEMVYWCLRHKASLEWYITRHPALVAESGASSPAEQAALDPGLRRNDNPPNARRLILTALALRGEENIPALFSSERHAPAPLSAEEKAYAKALRGKPLLHADMAQEARLNTPAWLLPYFEGIFAAELQAELEAMQAQAPVDVRANTLKTTRDALQAQLAAEGVATSATPLSPVGLRLEGRTPVFGTESFKAGLFEMQDAGSQMVALITGAKPGQKVIDFCAGAGGKTLALAAMMQNKGRILAWDTSPKRLEQIRPRLKRAGVDNVQTHVIASESDPFIKRHKDSADIVLVDAPCSGAGTWRRNPDLKWRFTESDLREVLGVQARILQSAARLVKPGGVLVYATCSLLEVENEAQVNSFLKTCNIFRVVSVHEIWDKTSAEARERSSPFLRLTPRQDGVDGFFAALLQRNA